MKRFDGEGFAIGSAFTRWMDLMVAAIFVVLIAAACGQAKADTRIGVHVGSQHFGRNAEQFNNSNPGLYLYHNGWTAGTYHNSERKQSAYAGYTFEYAVTKRITASATVGVITGYSQGTMPMLVPSVAYRFSDQWSARVSFVPKIEKGGAAAAHLSFERKF